MPQPESNIRTVRHKFPLRAIYQTAFFIISILIFTITQSCDYSTRTQNSETNNGIIHKNQISKFLFKGIDYRENYQLDSAIYFLNLAKRNIEKSNTPGYSRVFTELAIVFILNNDPERAREPLERAISIAETEKPINRLISALSTKSLLYHSITEYDSAIIIGKKILSIADSLNLEKEKIVILNNIGTFYEDDTKFNKALEYYNKALHLAMDSDTNKTYLNSIFNNIGNIHFNLDEFSLAEEQYLIALELSRNEGNLEDERIALYNLAELYKYTEKWEKAAEIYYQYDSVKDVLRNQEKIRAIEDMAARYELGKKEQLIELQKLNVRNANLQRNAIGGGLGAALIATLLVVWGWRQRHRRKLLETKQREQASRQALLDVVKSQAVEKLEALEEGREKERQRLARDLHDRVGSMLATVKMQFQSLPGRKDQPEWSHTETLLDEACGEVRRVSHDLAAGQLTAFGIEKALSSMVETINQAGGPQVDLNTSGLENALPAQIEVAIYSITQEALHNALKYAQSSRIEVQIDRFEDQLTLMVTDNGQGFEPQKIGRGEGLGLASMQQRAKKAGGSLHIDAALGRGTSIIVEIPVNISKP